MTPCIQINIAQQSQVNRSNRSTARYSMWLLHAYSFHYSKKSTGRFWFTSYRLQSDHLDENSEPKYSADVPTFSRYIPLYRDTFEIAAISQVMHNKFKAEKKKTQY
jgi:hypothetical protein